MQWVLDTNVVLDWLVFRDRHVTPIVAALERSEAGVWTNGACEGELIRVLAYAQFGLSADAQSHALDTYRQRARHFAGATDPRPLPRCADPDDQKFLRLAHDAGASHLITKDKSLLTLARARYGLRFRIVTPQALALTA